VGQRGHGKSRGLTFFYEKGNENHLIGTGFFVHHRIVLAVKRVEFASDSVLYKVLRGRSCNIIVRNVFSTNEEESYNSKDSVYEELEQEFNLFLNTM